MGQERGNWGIGDNFKQKAPYLGLFEDCSALTEYSGEFEP
jgi:hypothetical protein